MYIWTAIDVDQQLTAVRREAKRIESVVDFSESDITLPLHVSLKISCPIEEAQYEQVLRDLTAILEHTPGFEIRTKGIELHDTIAWIAMEENAQLKAVHESLDVLFLDRYGVPRHRFDQDFKFHTTLFLDHDSKKVKDAFLMIRNMELPPVLRADTFLIGMSPEGKVGTYRVIRRIEKNACRRGE